ncbi:MAG TPA: cytochrome c oxidase subunit 3 [Tepidisphaeraceae bacterium]|jgi:cytochrome c oxidase subunit 3
MSHAEISSPALQEQFDDAAQQKDAVTLGMWLFLATEILFFGGMFMGFSVYRQRYTAAFAETAHHLLMWYGAVNTAILLCSSFTVVLAVHFAHIGRNKAVISSIIATMILGAAFLCLKGREYYIEYTEHLIPNTQFVYGTEQKERMGIEVTQEEKDHPQTAAFAPQARIFMSFYFMMTGVHATHMIVGEGIFLWLLITCLRGKITPEYFTPVEICGLYWHFVDIVWIFVFPVLYLLHY